MLYFNVSFLFILHAEIHVLLCFVYQQQIKTKIFQYLLREYFLFSSVALSLANCIAIKDFTIPPLSLNWLFFESKVAQTSRFRTNQRLLLMKISQFTGAIKSLQISPFIKYKNGISESSHVYHPRV